MTEYTVDAAVDAEAKVEPINVTELTNDTSRVVLMETLRSLEHGSFQKLNDEELSNLVSTLVYHHEAMYSDLGNTTYDVSFKSADNVNLFVTYLKEDVKWTHKDAMNINNIYTKILNLKTDKSNKDKSVNFTTVELNQIYQIVTSMTGTGINSLNRHNKVGGILNDTILEPLKEMTEFHNSIRDLSSFMQVAQEEANSRTQNKADTKVTPEAETTDEK